MTFSRLLDLLDDVVLDLGERHPHFLDLSR